MSLQLGFPDEVCSMDEMHDKIGGYPMSFIPQPDHIHLSCGKCQSPMQLICQFVTLVDRYIYVFACMQSQCHLVEEGWIVLRCKKRSKTQESQRPTKSATQPLLPAFGSLVNLMDLQSMIEKRNQSLEAGFNQDVSCKKQESMELDKKWSHLPHFPCRSLEFEEIKASKETKKNASHGQKDWVELDPDWKGEAYEKMNIKGMSRTFKTFQKQVQLYPEQVIRYEWDGSPLFYHENSSLIPSKCSDCGASRVFEFQLMPNLMNYIPKESTEKQVTSAQDYKDSCVWTTILVYSCSKDCHKSNSSVFFAQEQVFVQCDQD